ncbi:MAG: cation-translocating P-type ATPase, partial [Bacteroidetes bacterium]|nr:cation-translocating P-type ATPase [Bacteroidota bacterium]
MSNSAAKVTLQIDGMDCSSCALTITKKLQKKGLENVTVNFATGEAQFSLPQDQKIGTIITDINSLGYRVVEENIKENFWNKYGTLANKLIFCTVFTIPLMLHMLIPHPILMNPEFQLLLTIPVMIVGIIHFGKSAYKSVLTLAPNMDVLIAIGSSSAFIYSLAGYVLYKNTHLVHNYLFFETAASIITLVLLGNYIEHKSVKKTTTAIKDLTDLKPLKSKKVTVVNGLENISEIKTEDIRINDVILINTGDKIPVDGIITEGTGFADESSLTGESLPVQKLINSTVTSGTILIDGSVKIKALAVGENTTLAKIIDLVKNAQHAKPSIQKLGDKISNIFVPAVLVIALATFFLNYFILDKSVQISVMNSIAVLVI